MRTAWYKNSKNHELDGNYQQQWTVRTQPATNQATKVRSYRADVLWAPGTISLIDHDRQGVKLRVGIQPFFSNQKRYGTSKLGTRAK